MATTEGNSLPEIVARYVVRSDSDLEPEQCVVVQMSSSSCSCAHISSFIDMLSREALERPGFRHHNPLQHAMPVGVRQPELILTDATRM